MKYVIIYAKLADMFADRMLKNDSDEACFMYNMSMGHLTSSIIKNFRELSSISFAELKLSKEQEHTVSQIYWSIFDACNDDWVGVGKGHTIQQKAEIAHKFEYLLNS